MLFAWQSSELPQVLAELAECLACTHAWNKHTLQSPKCKTFHVCSLCRALWGKLKVATAARLMAQAKQKAKHDLEVADAAAQEERVALQQYQ